MHSTDILEDGYIGSGKKLHNSIKKHGLENHKCEILEFMNSRQELVEREIQIVNEELLLDPLCMNLTIGGYGGWEYHNSLPENRIHRVKGRHAANIVQSQMLVEKRKNDPEFSKSLILKAMKTKMDRYGRTTPDWTGKKHKDVSKASIGEKNSIHQVGTGNSQFGKCWIHSLVEKKSISILKNELENFLSCGWKLGRKMKW